MINKNEANKPANKKIRTHQKTQHNTPEEIEENKTSKNTKMFGVKPHKR